jgi:predicted transcriptional regulator of viral defense system
VKDGRDEGGPWGFTTPRHLREETGIEKSTVEYCLRQLTTAGWLEKVTRGFYKFVRDPREEDDGN